MNRSIRLTLTFWYVGILAVILCLFSGALYTTVATTLSRDIDDLLGSQADGVADAIFSFWEAEQMATPADLQQVGRDRSPADIQTLDEVIEAGAFPSLVARWADRTGELTTGRPVRLMDREGQILTGSASVTALKLSPTSLAVTEARRGRTVYETFMLPDHRVRLITRPVIEGRRLLYLIQVAANLRQADTSLRQLRWWLVWLIPLTLVGTSAVGWLLASIALRPVGRMVTHAQRIGVEDLHERIDAPRTGDELEHLATTFNEMLARLERAFRRLRQFSAAASHELRTPLTVMKGELEVALRKPRSPDEYQRVLRTQLEALNEMVAIVEQLLLLSRSESSQGAIEWRPVEMVALIDRVRTALQSLAVSKNIHLEIPIMKPVWVRGEPRLLERLLVNLLDNALKHTPSGGRVTLAITQEETRTRLIVQDTGPGIPAEELPQIFDRFFSRRALTDGRSTGLGLGLCRWIAEAHGGRIEAASVPGAGATLNVWLLSTPPPSHPTVNEHFVM